MVTVDTLVGILIANVLHEHKTKATGGEEVGQDRDERIRVSGVEGWRPKEEGKPGCKGRAKRRGSASTRYIAKVRKMKSGTGAPALVPAFYCTKWGSQEKKAPSWAASLRAKRSDLLTINHIPLGGRTGGKEGGAEEEEEERQSAIWFVPD